MGAGARSGWSTVAGGGSNVQTTAGTASSRARLTAVVRIAAWARWMPSKVPSAATDGRSSGGKDARPRRIRMEEALGPHVPAATAAEPEQPAMLVVDAQEAFWTAGEPERLAVKEAARRGDVGLQWRESQEG